MSNIEAARKLYEQCKDMDIDETRELVLAAKNEDEIDEQSDYPTPTM